MLRLALLLSCVLISPAQAELEQARDLMDAGKFEAAYQELWPAAKSGNAEAEELIGVMYAMGLGVKRDDRRAFEWYLRSAMKGHPGATVGCRLVLRSRTWFASHRSGACLHVVHTVGHWRRSGCRHQP